MELVTVFWPFTMIGPDELVVQDAGETRFVVYCKVYPTLLVGHVKTILAPRGMIVSFGAKEGSTFMFTTSTSPNQVTFSCNICQWVV